ncbi:hypothetical protein MTR_6g079150 [Medicago truncatula]|uniref:Uncharacterized protein n=1 Tax=Medicago truncatula TaxID=3880 RepID=A0A072UCX5_MEDTR|nr:hypothetical protein MTR_6g079150 [Medicago truncatula]
MVQKTYKHWVNLLSSIYSNGSNFLFDASAHRNSSPTRSSITRAKNVLKTGYIWRAGSDNSSFWYSNWSTLGALGTQIPFVDIHDIHLTVHDVITNDGQHSQSLYTILPHSYSRSHQQHSVKFQSVTHGCLHLAPPHKWHLLY